MNLQKSKNISKQNNNLNLIRMCAALLVLLNHSFPLLGLPEPFAANLGITLGTVAVDVFFVISGYLVCASLMRKQDSADYFLGRIFRIYPALIFSTCFSALILGPYLTTLPLDSYFSNPMVLKFVLTGSSIVAGISMNLPGVFEGQPLSAVNGSLWTLMYEVKMYLLLFLLWIAARKFDEKMSTKFGRRCGSAPVILLLFCYGAGLILIVKTGLGYEAGYLSRFIFMFFSGATFFNFRENIVFKKWVFTNLVILLPLAYLYGALQFQVIYCLSIPYLTLYLAFIPAGVIRQYNRLGDYSYGTYIFAFPIQQTLASINTNISVVQLALTSLGVTLIFAFLSWHLIEKPILDRKDFYTLGVKKFFSSSRWA